MPAGRRTKVDATDTKVAPAATRIGTGMAAISVTAAGIAPGVATNTRTKRDRVTDVVTDGMATATVSARANAMASVMSASLASIRTQLVHRRSSNNIRPS